MKKLFLFAALLVAFGINSANAATITVTYKAGQICKGDGSNCTITVTYNFMVAAPHDVNPVRVPPGYVLTSIITDKWDPQNFTQATVVLGPDVTGDGSTITVPAQEYQYSEELHAFIVYAQQK